MKPINRTSILIIAFLLLTACGAKATETPSLQGGNPYAPQPADSDLQRNDITIDSSSLNLAESMPIQVTLNFAYIPLTPCNQLRVEVGQPDSQNQINVTAYSMVEKDKACMLMSLAKPVEASLNLGSFPSGHYTLLLNGTIVGEFDS